MELEDEIKFDIAVFDEYYDAFSGERYPIFEKCFNSIEQLSKKTIMIVPQKSVLPKPYNSSLEFKTDFNPTIRRQIDNSVAEVIIKSMRKRTVGN